MFSLYFGEGVRRVNVFIIKFTALKKFLVCRMPWESKFSISSVECAAQWILKSLKAGKHLNTIALLPLLAFKRHEGADFKLSYFSGSCENYNTCDGGVNSVQGGGTNFAEFLIAQHQTLLIVLRND